MHVVFHEEDINSLSKSFELDESLRGEVICINDDYSVGPLDVYSEEGITFRKHWWASVLAAGGYSISENNLGDEAVVEQIKTKLKSDEKEFVWIWMAANARDVSGYFWLLPQLRDFLGRVYILSLNNLPFINEKGGIFYPEYLFEISAREFLKAKVLARLITLSEFEMDAEEWEKMRNENKIVRVFDGAKKLSQHDADFYDAHFLAFIIPEWQKANKVVAQFLSKSKLKVSEYFIKWRMKELILKNLIAAQGDINALKDLEIKRLIPEQINQNEF